MNRRRSLVLVAVAAAAIAAATGTGSFSAAETDRGVAVSVASDERAYLAVETSDATVRPGPSKTVPLIDLENRMGRALTDVSVDVEDTAETPPLVQRVSAPRSLGPGTAGTVTAAVDCDDGRDGPDTETWTVSVEASGPGVTVSLDRTVAVTCEGTAGREANATSPPGTPSATTEPAT